MVSDSSVKVQVTQDQHMEAIEWLEAWLEEPTYMHDVDDVKAMVEQAVCEEI